MSFSQFTSQDLELISREWATLKDAARKRCANTEEFKTVLKAFEFANEAHKNVRRRSGDPYIMHPIAVARIVVIAHALLGEAVVGTVATQVALYVW